MINCSVCGERLSCAPENYGSFPSATLKITDTCEDCATRLKAAVELAAQGIRDEIARRKAATRTP